MASVLVFDKSYPNIDESRREGTASLGIAIIGNTATSSSIPPGKDYRDQLLLSISGYINNTTDYRVVYQFRETGIVDPILYDIVTAVARGSNQILCSLVDNSGIAPVAIGDVTLKVKVEDSRAINGGNKQFFMDVVYPDTEDLENFDYISEAAEDCDNLNNPAKEQGYLLAFKLISRCS